MGIGWNIAIEGGLLAEESFEGGDHGRVEHMFDGIGPLIDATWGDIGVGDEVDFPEAVIANELLGLEPAGFGEAEGMGGRVVEETVVGETADDALEVGWGPASQREEIWVGDTEGR